MSERVIDREPTTASRIDAYCHVGLPRFGSAEDALAVQALAGVDKTVLVLGPGVPDYGMLFGALQRYGDRVRGIGIPFGETAAQIRESVELQLRAGVIGLRVEPNALLRYPEIGTLIGEAGRWLYAIGAASPKMAEALLDWLARYPIASVAAPHFLQPGRLGYDDREVGGPVLQSPLCDLVAHPRFYPIFSRHGGVESRYPYPHEDLRPWVEDVLTLAGWDRAMWGSEYPVLTWRNETMASCQAWLEVLLQPAVGAQFAKYLGVNAQRAIFDVPAPTAETVTLPNWVEAQFNRDRTVPLFPHGLDVPMADYAALHHRYVSALRTAGNDQLTFADYVLRELRQAQ